MIGRQQERGAAEAILPPRRSKLPGLKWPKYEAGQDQKALLAMNWVVINAMNDANQRAATAARLAKILQDPATTAAARQFICAQLFRIGTEAEVSAVAPLLLDPATTDTARLFLERVKSEAAIAALRQALDKLEGRALIGVINSLSLIQDAASVDKIIALTKSQDAAVALAAWRALGNFGNEAAADFLIDWLEEGRQGLRSDGIRRRADRHSVGIGGQAGQGDGNLSSSGRRQAFPGARQAGFHALFAAAPDEQKAALIAQWSKSPDVAQQKVVISQMTTLSDAALEEMLHQQGIGEKVQIALMEELAARQGEKMLPAMLEAADSGDPAKVQMALRFLASRRRSAGHSGSHQGLGCRRSQRERVAADALAQRPKEVAGPALLEALNKQVDLREQVVDILSKMKYYEAIDPLTELARSTDPAVYEGAVEGLRAICDPDETDLKRMFALYLDVPAGAQRDYVERAIAYICEKNPERLRSGDDSPGLVDRHRDTQQDTFQAAVLPLLGRLGTDAVYQKIQPLLNSPTARTLRRRSAGVLQLADRSVRRRALGFGCEVRVHSLSLPGVAGVHPRGDPPQRPAGSRDPRDVEERDEACRQQRQQEPGPVARRLGADARNRRLDRRLSRRPRIWRKRPAGQSSNWRTTVSCVSRTRRISSRFCGRSKRQPRTSPLPGWPKRPGWARLGM